MRIDASMGHRLNWLFFIFIYLSINGQVFATAIHLCSEMAMNSSVLTSSNNAVNIHDHHDSSYQYKNKIIDKKHINRDLTTMDNCHCIDCDCMQELTGQTNSSLLQDTDLSDYLPVITTASKNLSQNFVSQPQSNPYRPPIIT